MKILKGGKMFEKKTKDKELTKRIEKFDEEAYLDANADVKKGIEQGQIRDALHHLEFFGLNEIERGVRKFHKGFEPFSEILYLDMFKDIVKLIESGDVSSGFEHFCLVGYMEIINGTREWKVAISNNIFPEEIQNAFDYNYYLEKNPDVKQSGQDPLDHYMLLGWKEGRSPNTWFNTRAYLEANVDISDAGLNPFEHYLLYGQSEGRELSNELHKDSIGLDDTNALMATIVASNAFDEIYYLEQLAEDEKVSNVNLLEHYMSIGGKKDITQIHGLMFRGIFL